MIFLIIRAATRSARNEALQNPAIKSANCPVVSGWPAIIPWWAKLRGVEESFGHSEQKTNARFIAETGGHQKFAETLRAAVSPAAGNHNLFVLPLRVAAALCTRCEWVTETIGRRGSDLWRTCQILSFLDGAYESRGIAIVR